MFSEYSRIRVPRPPQKSTTFMVWVFSGSIAFSGLGMAYRRCPQPAGPFAGRSDAPGSGEHRTGPPQSMASPGCIGMAPWQYGRSLGNGTEKPPRRVASRKGSPHRAQARRRRHAPIHGRPGQRRVALRAMYRKAGRACSTSAAPLPFGIPPGTITMLSRLSGLGIAG
jgi:hypothetical protein